MIYTLKMIDASIKFTAAAFILIILSAFSPVSAATQPVQFKNDIFNPNWWLTQPSKFVGDIFNRYWPLKNTSKFINDIFNPNWWLTQPSKFLNDIFRSKTFNNAVNSAIKSNLDQLQKQSAPTQSSTVAPANDCWALYTSACYNQCGNTIECLKGCSQKFALCMKGN